MKIYGQDHGYRGALFVVASSQEEAIAYMKGDDEFVPTQLPLDEYEIKPGVLFGSYGDA